MHNPSNTGCWLVPSQVVFCCKVTTTASSIISVLGALCLCSKLQNRANALLLLLLLLQLLPLLLLQHDPVDTCDTAVTYHVSGSISKSACLFILGGENKPNQLLLWCTTQQLFFPTVNSTKDGFISSHSPSTQPVRSHSNIQSTGTVSYLEEDFSRTHRA